MALNFNGTNQYLSAPQSGIASAPLTVSVWAKLTTLNGQPTLVSVEPAASNTTNGCILYVKTNGSNLGFYTYGGGVGGIALLSSPTVPTNTWFHAAGVVHSTTSRQCYLNGTGSSLAAGTAQSSVFNKILIAADTGYGLEAFASGSIAEVGVWSAALSASEISSLAKGVSPRLVRPQSLVFCSPLIRNLVDKNGGVTITNNNSATVADHPRIYY